jgi:predicted nucleotidyltransferase
MGTSSAVFSYASAKTVEQSSFRIQIAPLCSRGGGSYNARMEATPDAELNVPESLQQPFRNAIAAAAESWAAEMGERLVSVVLFGSVARREARETSDVDVIVVARGFPHSLRDRRRPLLEGWEKVRAERGLPWVSWNLVTKTPEEARYHSPLYLDIVEDGVLILDRDGFFGAVLSAMRERMRVLGSRRIYLDDGTWYWDLKPDFRFGEVVEI